MCFLLLPPLHIHNIQWWNEGQANFSKHPIQKEEEWETYGCHWEDIVLAPYSGMERVLDLILILFSVSNSLAHIIWAICSALWENTNLKWELGSLPAVKTLKSFKLRSTHE